MGFIPAIKKGPTKKEPRMLIIGVEGVGKSTAGAMLPAPLFICSEDGLIGPQFHSTPSVSPKTWAETLQTLEWLATDKGHQYKSIVIDTLDWIEPQLFAHVVDSARKPDIRNIEDFGYGKGYALAAAEFRQLLGRLESVNASGLIVCILAHSQIKAFNNPAGENYDRYEPKVCKQIAGLVKEWCDCVLFAHFDSYAKKDGTKSKGMGGQVRVVETTHCAAWDAKNRYGLPPTMVLDIPTILGEIRALQPSNQEDMIKEITDLLPSLSEDKRIATKAWLEKSSYTSTSLAQMLNKIRADLNQENK